MGQTYTYVAQRVRTLTLAGQTIELRSAPSAPVVVVMCDVFPPDPPAGLLAVPGFVPAAGDQPAKPAIDLSWQPNAEAGIAGYRVYRRELGANAPWHPLTVAPAASPAFSDRGVEAGHRYEYQVTAIDTAGNESTPSAPVAETAAAP
jgi:hypothetical protein